MITCKNRPRAIVRKGAGGNGRPSWGSDTDGSDDDAGRDSKRPLVPTCHRMDVVEDDVLQRLGNLVLEGEGSRVGSPSHDDDDADDEKEGGTKPNSPVAADEPLISLPTQPSSSTSPVLSVHDGAETAEEEEVGEKSEGGLSWKCLSVLSDGSVGGHHASGPGSGLRSVFYA